MASIGKGFMAVIGLIGANLPLVLFILGFVVVNAGIWFYLGWGTLIFVGISLIIIGVTVETTIKELEDKEKDVY